MERKVCTPAMSPIASIVSVLCNPSFKGRSRRSEFWWFSILAFILIEILRFTTINYELSGTIAMVLTILLLITCFYELSITTRRLHDLNISGWWLIPVVVLGEIYSFWDDYEIVKYLQNIIRIIIAIICMFDGKPQVNKYGISPKYSTTDEEYDSYTQETEKNKASALNTSIISLGCIVNACIPILLTFLACRFLCNIDPEEYYVWYHGIWHGIFIIPNWIFSFFDSDILCKAENYSTGYNIFWWLTLIWQILSMLLGGSR